MQNALWLALAFVACLAAGETGPRYSFQHYGEEAGLGNSTVLSLLQDKAGFLWVGTESGLYRFDGSHFHLIGADEGLACLAEIRGLTQATDGALWVVACNHLYRSSSGHFELATHKEIIIASLHGMTSNAEDGVLVGVSDGILQGSSKRDEQGRLIVEMIPLPPPVGGRSVRGLLQNQETIWFGSEQGLWSLAAGHLTRHDVEEGLPAADWDGIAVTAAGDLWVRSLKQTFWKPHGQARFRAIQGLAPSFFSGYIGLGGDGSVLIPTTNGLALINEQGSQNVGDAQGLHTSLTSVALEDRQGSIWVGLLGEGLARWLGRDEWQSWTKDNGLPSNLIWGIQRARSDRALWVATAQGVVRFPTRGPPRTWDWKQHVEGVVRWLREAPDGAFWLIAQGDTLARIEPHSGAVKFFGKAQGIPANHLVRGSFDQKGNLWIATADGLFMATRPTVSAHFNLVSGSPRGLWDVAEDKQGSMFATSAHGLWRFREGHWRRYGKSDGLLVDSEYVIAVAPDGAFWFRHRYDGLVERVVFDGDRVASVLEIKPDGVPTELTALHGFDSLGRYWQGTPHGLSMLADPVAYAAPRGNPAAPRAIEPTVNPWQHFSAEDGLVSNDCDGEAFWADDDGSVWIGTSNGLAHYSPRKSKIHPLAGPGIQDWDAPVITSMLVSQRPRAARIEFSSLDFKTVGQAQFAYSIDDGNWVDAKERAVTLAALRPGQHHFRVRIHTWGHPWSKQTSEAQFHFEPFWWETWWAELGLYLTIVSVAAGVLGLWLKLQRRRAAERAHILGEKARAEAASQAKSLFLAHMSHEIRTPLHQIIGLTEDLSFLDLPPAAHEIVGQLRASGTDLFGLLNGILDFSKMEAGKLEIGKSQFNLNNCLDETVALFSKAAGEKGIVLRLEREPALPSNVVGDDLRLRQVLVCLISNAVKFTECGVVHVKASCTSHEAPRSTVEFSVTDTGIGIPQERLSTLFRPFAQGDASMSRRHGGTGLGLIIARSLVQLMGSDDLWVESQPGRGTSFRFAITFEHAQAQPEAAECPATASSKLRILLAEDNKINQKIMSNLLARMGYTADFANDGAEAIAAAARQTYDVILMDIQMPNVDGLQATRAIRMLPPDRTQPRIFAVTAHATSDDHTECLNAGMDGYLTKPVSRELLSRTLAEVEKSLAWVTVPA